MRLPITITIIQNNSIQTSRGDVFLINLPGNGMWHHDMLYSDLGRSSVGLYDKARQAKSQRHGDTCIASSKHARAVFVFDSMTEDFQPLFASAMAAVSKSLSPRVIIQPFSFFPTKVRELGSLPCSLQRWVDEMAVELELFFATHWRSHLEEITFLIDPYQEEADELTELLRQRFHAPWERKLETVTLAARDDFYLLRDAWPEAA